MPEIIFGPWSGAVTSSSAVVKAAVPNDSQVRLLYATQTDDTGNLLNPISLFPSSISHSEISVTAFTLDALTPNTDYRYVLEVNGRIVSAKQGKFRTFPPENAASSFTFVCAGDARTGSEHEVFETVINENPLFFLHLGDLHYEDIHQADTRLYRDAYRRVLNSRTQANLYRNVPIAYIWDDHDFDRNDSNRTAPGRLAARSTYQECVPHYPLVKGAGNVPIHQAFTVGRVRFLLTDSRSEKTPSDHSDDQHKTVLGQDQKDWLKKELLDGKNQYRLVVWVNSIPWIGPREPGSDRWFGYATERAELSTFIKNNGIRNVCMVSADAHMLAIDDGRHAGYAAGGGGGFPIFHAASLDSGPSVKGGPYSHGTHPGRGQYGIFRVEDTDGPTVTVTWEGKHYREGRKLFHKFESPRP